MYLLFWIVTTFYDKNIAMKAALHVLEVKREKYQIKKDSSKFIEISAKKLTYRVRSTLLDITTEDYSI